MEADMEKHTSEKRRLIELRPECLAEALLDLANRNDMARDMVEGLIATPQENLTRFKAFLLELRRPGYFYDWREVRDFSQKLCMMLQTLKEIVTDPKTGAALIAEFYKTDAAVLNHCDDSTGQVGDVFRYDARELFVHFASRCKDNDWLCTLILELFTEDDYGVRDSLICCANRYLGKASLRSLVSQMWPRAEEAKDDYEKRHWLFGIQSLASQMKDAPLYEKAARAAWPSLTTSSCVDISRAYIEAGDAKTALNWLKRVPDDETFMSFERDNLMLEIQRELGDTEGAAEAAWRVFRSHRTMDSLSLLLSILGQDKREQVIDGEADNITNEKTLRISDATFLMEADRIDVAESYLLSRTEQLNGDSYYDLVPLAKAMENEERFLAATMLYRSLLDSILRRANSKYYHHGVRYLKTLDRLAPSIHEWHTFENHEAYKSALLTKHARKRSFWGKYQEK